MTARQLYEFCQKFNLEDAELRYPMYANNYDLLAQTETAEVILTSEDQKPEIVLKQKI